MCGGAWGAWGWLIYTINNNTTLGVIEHYTHYKRWAFLLYQSSCMGTYVYNHVCVKYLYFCSCLHFTCIGARLYPNLVKIMRTQSKRWAFMLYQILCMGSYVYPTKFANRSCAFCKVSAFYFYQFMVKNTYTQCLFQYLTKC